MAHNYDPFELAVNSKEERANVMRDVFISYARGDSARAEAIMNALEDLGATVFIDQTVRPGNLWTNAILAQLDSARIVLVLWSVNSVGSIWVLGEASKAAQRGVLFPVRLDESTVPFPFDQMQCSSLLGWDGTLPSKPLDSALDRVMQELGGSFAYGNMESVEPNEEVDRRHLHLIDTTWRDEDMDKRYSDGRSWYQLRAVVFGHRSALDRVERVDYDLPGYPGRSAQQAKLSDARTDCFQLKELANGFTVIQAKVSIRDQPDGSPDVIHLARFVLLGESGPRLDPLIQQARPTS